MRSKFLPGWNNFRNIGNDTFINPARLLPKDAGKFRYQASDQVLKKVAGKNTVSFFRATPDPFRTSTWGTGKVPKGIGRTVFASSERSKEEWRYLVSIFSPSEKNPVKAFMENPTWELMVDPKAKIHFPNHPNTVFKKAEDIRFSTSSSADQNSEYLIDLSDIVGVRRLPDIELPDSFRKSTFDEYRERVDFYRRKLEAPNKRMFYNVDESSSQLMNSHPNRVQTNISGHRISGIHGSHDEFSSPWKGWVKNLVGIGAKKAMPGRTAAGKLSDITNTFLLDVKRTQAASKIGSDATINFLQSAKSTGRWDAALIDRHISSMSKSISLSGVDISPESFSQLMNSHPNRVQTNISGHRISGIHGSHDEFSSPWKGLNSKSVIKNLRKTLAIGALGYSLLGSVNTALQPLVDSSTTSVLGNLTVSSVEVQREVSIGLKGRSAILFGPDKLDKGNPAGIARQLEAHKKVGITDFFEYKPGWAGKEVTQYGGSTLHTVGFLSDMPAVLKNLPNPQNSVKNILIESHYGRIKGTKNIGKPGISFKETYNGQKSWSMVNFSDIEKAFGNRSDLRFVNLGCNSGIMSTADSYTDSRWLVAKDAPGLSHNTVSGLSSNILIGSEHGWVHPSEVQDADYLRTTFFPRESLPNKKVRPTAASNKIETSFWNKAVNRTKVSSVKSTRSAIPIEKLPFSGAPINSFGLTLLGLLGLDRKKVKTNNAKNKIAPRLKPQVISTHSRSSYSGYASGGYSQTSARGTSYSTPRSSYAAGSRARAAGNFAQDRVDQLKRNLRSNGNVRTRQTVGGIPEIDRLEKEFLRSPSTAKSPRNIPMHPELEQLYSKYKPSAPVIRSNVSYGKTSAPSGAANTAASRARVPSGAATGNRTASKVSKAASSNISFEKYLTKMNVGVAAGIIGLGFLLLNKKDGSHDERIQTNLGYNQIDGMGNPYSAVGMNDFGSAWAGFKSMLGLGAKKIAPKAGITPHMKKVYASRQLGLDIDKFRREIPGIGTDVIQDFVNAAKKTVKHDPATLDAYMSKLTKTITMSENVVSKEQFASLMRSKADESLKLAQDVMKTGASSHNANAKISLKRNRTITKSRKTPSY